MPDFRAQLDEAKFKPQFAGQSTTGPNGDGAMQTWQNRPGLEESSAQQLARLLGADLTEVNYNGGPYSQQRPQYQLDFDTGNLHDGSMVASNYQNSPQFFNSSLQAELASDRAKPVAIQEMEARAAAGQGAYMLPPPGSSPQGPGGHPPTPPPANPGGSGPNGPGPTWPAPPPTTKPGPSWPAPTAPNSPGPVWQLPTLPGAPTAPSVVKAPTSGVSNPGGYTSQPLYSGAFPQPIMLAVMQQQQAEQQAAQRAGLLGSSYRGGGLLGGAY